MSRNEDNNRISSSSSFKEIYAQAVNEAMSILGEGASLVTGYLERKYSISLDDIAENPKLLSDALYSAIDGGARIVQRRILRLLYEKMNIKIPSVMLMTVNFEDRVLQAKEDYANRAHKIDDDGSGGASDRSMGSSL